MKKFEIKKIKSKKEIDALSNVSALTFIGLDPNNKSLEQAIKWLNNHNALTEENLVFHVISGKLMNKEFGLSGTNRYAEDLSIISITGIDITKIILARFDVGGRWLDDIIDNNLEREI